MSTVGGPFTYEYVKMFLPCSENRRFHANGKRFLVRIGISTPMANVSMLMKRATINSENRRFHAYGQMLLVRTGVSMPAAKVSTKGGVSMFHLYGEVFHRSADALLEQGASHHHRASVVTELLLQLMVLKLARHDARHHLQETNAHSTKTTEKGNHK